MVAGLEEITRGDIYIGDTLINNLHPKDRNIGLAFEDYALYPPLNVYENIAFNLSARGVSRRRSTGGCGRSPPHEGGRPA
ncbi:hypothetical protein MASR2M17_07720 [Aminivibrio sp.]